jgi:hypothetical protein
MAFIGAIKFIDKETVVLAWEILAASYLSHGE